MDEAALCDRVALMHARPRPRAAARPAAVAASFPRRLLAVHAARTSPRRAARLRAAAVAGLDVQPFGDRLHLVHDDDAAGPRAARAPPRPASGAGGWRQDRAGIEDAFMALMGAPEGEERVQ